MISARSTTEQFVAALASPLEQKWQRKWREIKGAA
jgi:hypothetical protein